MSHVTQFVRNVLKSVMILFQSHVYMIDVFQSFSKYVSTFTDQGRPWYHFQRGGDFEIILIIFVYIS